MSAPSEPVRTLVNGHRQTSISAFDRGFTLADGLFETIAIRGGRPLLWEAHCGRLEQGCGALGLIAPERELLTQEIAQLRGGDTDGTVRITVTRGPGARGYALPAEPTPTRVVSFDSGGPFFGASPLRLRWCETRIGLQPRLAGIKHLGRLEQVLARAEWNDPHIDEGVVQSVDGRVIECVAANLFLVRENVLITPTLSDCGVAGVARGQVLATARTLDIETEERDVGPGEVNTADELFLTSSVRGIAPIGSLAQQSFAAPGPITAQLIEHSDWLR
ncbi:MAG: aminodeoxychorismate lyase [Halofilum sp. (in: g-proteobacteria)]